VDGVAAALGIEVWRLLDDPVNWLAEFRLLSGRRKSAPDAPPTEARVAGWHAGLLGDSVRLKRLRRERGLTLRSVRRFEIGWDHARRAYTLPVRNLAGELVNVSWRAQIGARLSNGAKITRQRRGIADGALPLYPQPLPPDGGLLVEGEWDALLARQHGLPAFTGLLGKQWNDAWDEYALGRVIAVAYDTGAEDDAARTVERLRVAGARRAWVVALDLPEEGDDLVDWFVKYRRSAADLRRTIRRPRRHR
jgi:hypothetical protein